MRSDELHRRASALFLDLRQQPTQQRSDALAALAHEDAALHQEVSELLAYDEAGPGCDGGAASATPHVFEGDLPESIGPYRVISRIGRGGSGLVYRAEQDVPIRRTVAIKVVPQAAVNPELAMRFEIERKALECTSHPNIARVLDAGRTPDGLPYLVMDFVEGVPISTYCETHQLSVSQRIGLMLDVADAMQHAHQRGVIHRDLKPANILVTETNGQPSPRVLDFGIAKPVLGDSGFAGDSPPTSGLPLGTPSYMAPEQTTGAQIDTRADVYALGAVLYELIAGRVPIEGRGDPLDVLVRIREQVPPPPSRVRTMPGTLSASRMKDLDCIIAKAMEKSPDRRYSTVDALADDLRRLQRFEPIQARRPTVGYRFSRFAQRNRAIVASAAVVPIAIVIGVGGLVAGLIEANHQRREATEMLEAQNAINAFLTDDLLAAASPDDMGADITALALLERASVRLKDRFEQRPLIAAAIHHTLGNGFAELGAYDQAREHLEQAVHLRHTYAGIDSPQSVHSEVAMASYFARVQQNEQAERALRAVIPRARLIVGLDDPVLYTAMNDLGVVLITMSREDEAIAVLREALAGRTRLLGPQHREVLVTTGNLAHAYDLIGESERALAMMKEGLRIAESLPDEPRFTVIGYYNNIGATYQDIGDDEAAAPYLRKAGALAEEALGPDHPATLQILTNLAGLEADLGDPDLAADMLKDLVERRRANMADDSWDVLSARYAYYNALWKAKRLDEAVAGLSALLPTAEDSLGKHWFTAQTRSMLAWALADSGEPAQALPHVQQAVAELKELYGEDHYRTLGAISTLDHVQSLLAKRE